MADFNFAHLLPSTFSSLVSTWLAEDVPSFDYGGFVVGETDQVAILYGKAKGVLAGVPFFDEVFRQVNCRVEWVLSEGTEFDPAADGGKKEVARVYGKARNILLGERPALNMLARASGIATRARKLKKIQDEAKWKGVIAGTRKTTPVCGVLADVGIPGFRLVEKYAMLVGGIDTHRVDLSSMIMLKDNHIWASGSITKAVQAARKVGGFALKIEVECRSEAEADEAIAAGADIVMLDNFEGAGFVAASTQLKDRWRGKKEFLVEGSGGLTEDNVRDYFGPDVDVLSFGSVTQSVPHIDFSLKHQSPRVLSSTENPLQAEVASDSDNPLAANLTILKDSPARSTTRHDLFEQHSSSRERPKTAPSNVSDRNALATSFGRSLVSRYSQSSYTLTPSSSQRSSTSYKEEARHGDVGATQHEKRQETERRKDIVIHVFDENRNAKRDFYCKRNLLLKEMKYFSTYLNERNNGTQVEIDVHCDIEVFDWLMCFITKQKPLLEPRMAVSILISSNFLQMQGLESICLAYVHDNINEIVKVPIDMSCINKPLLSKLSKLFSITELSTIIDLKDKMIRFSPSFDAKLIRTSSKLYMFKLDELLTTPVINYPELGDYNECFKHDEDIGCKKVAHSLDKTSETFRMFEENRAHIFDEAEVSEGSSPKVGNRDDAARMAEISKQLVSLRDSKMQ
ncbi:hypothetical protein HDU67_006686 [Dinochytrium kinnereticum]|nr:hypothetical protein HDU67_006686 [Dinochytrium kinnereticum]